MKMAIAGTGCVGLPLSVLLAQAQGSFTVTGVGKCIAEANARRFSPQLPKLNQRVLLQQAFGRLLFRRQGCHCSEGSRALR